MLSWNEIILRAKKFSKEWQNANYEKGETQSFYNDFFQVFGRKRRDVGIYERAVEKLNNKHGFIDLFWPSVLLVEQKSEGRDLEQAQKQAIDYYVSLKESEKPR
ncbi:MAG: type IIL restriction-modification enzyme MmeI, partial [Pseudomonadota bacterium]|nr:type IIL restriction-modification enzyme MmeI [Pseudomonadota bacterium]